MDTDIKIGKVKDYNKFSGVGEIVTIDDTYIFTLDNLVDCNIDNGDIVKFRAEKVNDKNIAFFVNKYDLNTDTAKAKKYYSNSTISMKKNDN